MISNKGRARSNKTNNVLKGKTRADGYLEWCFSINGKKETHMAHRIVYEAFYGPIENEYVINHIDGDRTNCQLSNLEKITQSENVNHGIYTLKSSKKVKPVGKYTMSNELLEVYLSCAEAARQNEGCIPNLIVNVCNHKKNSHHGFIWKYIDEE
ncbi:MAG: HNH endonuclease [Lachnospiraceae bacterium]|nr:HNH endonuclease [Lachnospiraceae bacterium]